MYVSSINQEENGSLWPRPWSSVVAMACIDMQTLSEFNLIDGERSRDQCNMRPISFCSLNCFPSLPFPLLSPLLFLLLPPPLLFPSFFPFSFLFFLFFSFFFFFFSFFFSFLFSLSLSFSFFLFLSLSFSFSTSYRRKSLWLFLFIFREKIPNLQGGIGPPVTEKKQAT